MSAYEAVLVELRDQRQQIDVAIRAIEGLLPAPTNGQAKAPARAKADKAPAKRAPKAAPAKKGKRAERAAEIQRRLAAGETVGEVAKALGVSESAIYLHRKKMGKAAPKAKAEAKPGVKYRCAECSQTGYDPVRCDHCQEKR